MARKRRILIIEDSEFFVAFLSELLKSEGYHLTCLVSEEPERILGELEQKVQEFQPDVAIVDGLNGKYSGVINIIKKTRPDTDCIIFTADPDSIRIRQERGKEHYKVFDKFDCERLLNYLENP